MSDLFAKAARLKLRFVSPQGSLSAEDLWDLPLTSNNGKRANLDDLAIALDKQLKESSTVSFVKKTSKTNELIKLRFDIVLHVIEVLQKEAEEDEKKVINAEKKQKLLSIIAQKEDESLAGKSVEELRSLIDAL